MTPQQCRAARAVLGYGVRDLAKLADVSPNTIARLERGERLHQRTLAYLQGAMEAVGVVFIEAGQTSRWGGPGIRYGANERLSPMAEVFRAFSNLPNLHTHPAAAYNALLEILDDVLKIIRGQGREPDSWERLNLNDALKAFDRSDVFGAQAHIWHGITPPDNQGQDYPIPNEYVAEVKDCNLSYFRKHASRLRKRGYVRR